MTDPEATFAKATALMAELEEMYVRISATNARLAIPSMKLSLDPTMANLRATMLPLRELSDELLTAGSLVRRFVDLIEPETEGE